MSRGYPDYEGDKSGLYLIPEWAAKEAVDKNFTVISGAIVFGFTAETTYVIPTGKTLYIVGLSFASVANLAADGDNNQMAFVDITIDTAYLSFLGGNGGGAEGFAKPMVFTEGTTFKLRVWNRANHTSLIYASCWGYEL